MEYVLAAISALAATFVAVISIAAIRRRQPSLAERRARYDQMMHRLQSVDRNSFVLLTEQTHPSGAGSIARFTWLIAYPYPTQEAFRLIYTTKSGPQLDWPEGLSAEQERQLISALRDVLDELYVH